MVRGISDTQGGSRWPRGEDLYGIPDRDGNLAVDMVAGSLSCTTPPFCSRIQPSCLVCWHLRIARAIGWRLLTA